MRILIACLAILFLVSACASAPRTRRPALRAEIPQKWASDSEATAARDALWWTRFGDVQLNRLVDEALDQNYNLREAAARLESAAARATIAGAPRFPQLSADFSGSRSKQNFIGLPIPGEKAVTRVTTNRFGVSLDLAWEVDLWGRLGAGRAAALADLQAAAADLKGARLSLAAQTAKAWFATVEASRQVELAQATVDNYETSHQQVRARYERGLRPSLDLRLSLSSLATARDLLEQRKQQLDGAARQLEILLGRYPVAAIISVEGLPSVADGVPAGMRADLAGRRPDLIAAERRLAASHARVAESRKALYPRIRLTASGGTASNELSDLLNGDFSVWNLVGNLVQPLFQGGRLRAGVLLAASESERALARYAQSVLHAFAEVESALAAEGLLARRQDALQMATEEALAARRLAEERYRAGLADLITVLESQRRAYDAESRLLSVRRLRLDARIDLHLALGGGFPPTTASEANEEKEVR